MQELMVLQYTALALGYASRGTLGLGQKSVQGQKLHWVNVELVAIGVGCCYNPILHLDGEVLQER